MSIQGYNDILVEFSPSVRSFIQYLWKDLNFGLCKSKIDIERLRSSNNNLSDQFTLVLPYAGKSLRWEVLFDSSAPWFAPDFRFDDEGFLANTDDDFFNQLVPSLVNWDDTDPRALSKVISELMSAYRLHQCKLLSEDENSRAYFEYTALLGDATISDDDLEILVGTGSNVNFMIRLNVDTTQLPLLYGDSIQENPGGECALLLVRYPNPSGAELIMSPLVLRAVGNITLPAMHQSGVLMDYVPMVTTLLNKKISTVVTNEKLKRELLSHMIVKYEGAILEHDANSASFLFEVKSFHWILHVDLVPQFPEKSPTLTLRSVYHCTNGRPITKVLPNCPYHKLEEYIEQQVEIFKNECIASQSLTPIVPPT